ncbi:uncharacterized protein LOC106951706 [Poecilia latipinna]|uniref:uncharacterized protein LOC106951706 n=1 Tax=Poecilia latipinna TaxID=48699 RepID=UPI00072DFD80|nr:PREDICTED: uncharacterized protein LOC106951706 [Poecilia latipinna]
MIAVLASASSVETQSEGKRKERAIGAVRSTPETTKMGRLSLMMFSLAVLLFAANSLEPVNEALLEDLVPQILNRCLGQWNGPMYSLAVRIPLNSETNMYDINQVTDAADEIQKKILKSEVYTGTRVVAATAAPGEHAEYRTLQNLNTILNNRNTENDLLFIYVYASPCATRCTNIRNKGNILDLLKGYKKYKPVFVFSKIFKPLGIRAEDSAEDPQVALRNLGGAIGLQSIFRCDKVNYIMRCVNCKSNGNVAGWCYDDNQPPA